MKFGGENSLPYQAVRILLAMKFGVMPDVIDNLPFSEVVEILSVLDGESKASKESQGGRGDVS